MCLFTRVQVRREKLGGNTIRGESGRSEAGEFQLRFISHHVFCDACLHVVLVFLLFFAFFRDVSDMYYLAFVLFLRCATTHDVAVIVAVPNGVYLPRNMLSRYIH